MTELAPKYEIYLEDNYGFSFLDQLKAGEYTSRVITYLANQNQLHDSLRVLTGKDVYRHLCLPCATGTAVNWLAGKRVIGDDDLRFRVGDMLKILLPFHKRKDFFPKGHPNKEKGFLIITEEGNFYHLPMICFGRGIGLKAESVRGFETVEVFREFVGSGGVILVGIDNKFILDRMPTQFKEKNGEKWTIISKIGSEETRINFRRTGHLVCLLNIERQDAIIADPYRLPQTSGSKTIMRIPISVLDQYLTSEERKVNHGIVFANKRTSLGSLKKYVVKSFVPKEVIEAVRRETFLSLL